MAEVLTVDGHRAPPTWFVKALERFDPNLRVKWGIDQAVPWPGWVIERRIPDHMKAVVYGRVNGPRYADREITDHAGHVIGRQAYDMMPDWWEIHRVEGELGEHVIDHLRRNYEKTLLGHPALAMRHSREFQAEQDARAAETVRKLDEEAVDRVMDDRNQIFKDQIAFGPQPAKVFQKETA